MTAPVTSKEGASTAYRFWVMRPELVLESRVHNVAGLPDRYDTRKGLEHLRLSIVCAQEFMRDVLDRTVPSENPERVVLKFKRAPGPILHAGPEREGRLRGP